MEAAEVETRRLTSRLAEFMPAGTIYAMHNGQQVAYLPSTFSALLPGREWPAET